jgi:acyl-CoA thioester hydrolase
MDLRMADLAGRVLVSRERVKFAAADPYGHLGSGAYVDMIMSHRVEALHDLIGFSIVQYAQSSGIAFPARRIVMSYLRPAFVGEVLEIGSWIEELGASSFEVRASVTGADDRRVRAIAAIHFVTVDARTGRPLPSPETLPSNATLDPFAQLPSAMSYRESLTGLPAQWADAATSPRG